MTMTSNLVDWVQLADLLGDANDESQRLVLAEMWRDMIADLERELAALVDLASDAEVKMALHRLAGFVSMWGFRELAARMKAIEKGPAPLVELRRQQKEIVAIADASRREITGRHLWLGVIGGT